MKWGLHFDVANLRVKVNELEEKSMQPAFWEDQEQSHKLLQQIKALRGKIESYDRLQGNYEDAVTLTELGILEQDASVADEAEALASSFFGAYDGLRIATLLNGEYDKNNVIVTLHSGAGGTESCDWTEMLLRMYQRWAEKRGFGFEVLDFLDGEGAGLKSVTFQIDGENAFGYMRSEKGVHRLVRISPFDASGRRHTSFASCDLLPELDDDVKVDIDPDDLRIDTYRSSGAGGQHVNKTESAIRITHMPSGIVVQCQNERSQFKNKDRAMKMLKAKLHSVRQEEQMQKISGIRGEVKDIAWGSQIRSYVFHPYSMVKDHRTNFEVGATDGVMDGGLDGFITAYLQMQ